MEAMFKDIEVSADLTAQFKASDEYPKETDMHFQINVIAQGIWPTYAMSEILLPPLVSECMSCIFKKRMTYTLHR